MNTKTMVIKSLGSMFDLCPNKVKEPEVYKATVHLNLEYDLTTDDVDSHWLDVSEHVGGAFLELTRKAHKNESLLMAAKNKCLNFESNVHMLDLSNNLSIEALEDYWVKDEIPERCSTVINHQEVHLESNYDR